MQGLKKFLRMEISGYVAILYALLLCAALFDLKAIRNLGLLSNVRIIDYSVTGFILAAPIGFIMHQIDISFASPFREHRLFTRRRRRVISLIRDYLGTKTEYYADHKCQAFLEYVLGTSENKHLIEKISNRYSYYYARVEAGLFAPIFGIFIFTIVTLLIKNMYCHWVIQISKLSVFVILVILIQSMSMIGYISTLFREIDDLEYLAVEKIMAKEKNEGTL